MPVSSILHKEDEKKQDIVKNLKSKRKLHPESGILPKFEISSFKNHPFTSQYLSTNATFIGEQNSNLAKYKINVKFKSVDLLSSQVTGFLQIIGLAENLKTMTTCFRGEIINNPLLFLDSTHLETPITRYSFITENKSWGSTQKNDLEHWKHLTNSTMLDDDEFLAKLSRIQNGEIDRHLMFMRWKEQFLLPDSRKKLISGTSFDGFYYIVLSIGDDEFDDTMKSGFINGLYYYKVSEKFQSLNLKFVNNRGVRKVTENV